MRDPQNFFTVDDLDAGDWNGLCGEGVSLKKANALIRESLGRWIARQETTCWDVGHAALLDMGSTCPSCGEKRIDEREVKK